MAILPILHFPDKRLHLKAKIITKFDNALHKLIDDMAETMHKHNGIGLAATQVNVQKRIFIVNLDAEANPHDLKVFINPEIVSRSGNISGEEGCLSVPGIYESVVRAESICVKFQDSLGIVKQMNFDGLMSVCIQHEIDHLNGIVFVEYLSNLKQTFIKKKMNKIFKPE